MLGFEVAPNSLRVDSKNPLFLAGEIWLQVDTLSFPATGWSDSPLSVIGSFGAALVSVLAGEEDVDAYFFEGPYFVKLLGSADSDLRVVGVCDRYTDNEGGGKVEVESTASLARLIDNYEKCVGVLLEWATTNGEYEVLSALSRLPHVRDTD